MLGPLERWLRQRRAAVAAQAARERRLRQWAQHVPLSLSVERCPLCAAELAARAAVAQEAALGPATGPRRWLTEAELCALHEAWLGSLRPAGAHPVAEPVCSAPDATGPARSVRRSRWARPAPEPPCALCAVERLVAERAARILVVRLTRVDERLAYAAGPGLCVRHVRRVAALAPPEVRAFLLDVLPPRLVALHAELGEFFRKEDYRYRHEPRGAEQTAWQRAIAQLVGPPELALPGTGLRDGC